MQVHSQFGKTTPPESASSTNDPMTRRYQAYSKHIHGYNCENTNGIKLSISHSIGRTHR